jgi:hypothetical protein
MMGNHDSVFTKMWEELQSDAFVSVMKVCMLKFIFFTKIIINMVTG